MTNESTGTVIELTREFVAESIEREPMLEAGQFVAYADPDDLAGGCAACAVGAVMRRAMAADSLGKSVVSVCSATSHAGPLWPRGEIGHDATIIERARAEAVRAPMNALSYLFESLSKTRSVNRARGEVAAFVREHFPETIRVNINGFAPAADVRVVSR